jgi:DGQHR domain-containing protein
MDDTKREVDVATDPAALIERETKEKRALAVLLDRYVSSPTRILVQKTEMGSTESYIGSVTLDWFAQRVRYANLLPLFQQKIDPETLKLTIDAATISEIQQRPLNWSRQVVLAQYLAVRKVHKFPPVLVVLNREWVDNPKADEWRKDGRALRSVADFVPLDNEGKVGLLDLSAEVTLYALDGQHRLMGVKGLMELINSGMLAIKDRDGKPTGENITIQGLESEFKVPRAQLQSLAKEKIGIEFISAVVPAESREEARRRVRSIFVHVNRMATPLTAGQLAQLDEDDGFSIVARSAAVEHELVRDKPGRDRRVDWDKSTISPKSTVLTTLQTLREMTKLYLQNKFPQWQPKKSGYVPIRPEDGELDAGLRDFEQLLDHMATLPSFKSMENGTSTTELRNFRQDGGQANVLFRPVGQAALAQALGILTLKDGHFLDSAFEKLQKYDQKGGFVLDKPESVFYMVLYDPNKEKMVVSGRDLAARLLVYLLGGTKDPDEQEELRKELAAARTTADKAVGFHGRQTDPDQVKLPPVL